jgi:hypothetical protein
MFYVLLLLCIALLFIIIKKYKRRNILEQTTSREITLFDSLIFEIYPQIEWFTDSTNRKFKVVIEGNKRKFYLPPLNKIINYCTSFGNRTLHLRYSINDHCYVSVNFTEENVRHYLFLPIYQMGKNAVVAEYVQQKNLELSNKNLL